MFTLGFLGLTVVYLAVAVCIIYGVAIYYKKDPKEFLRNNNNTLFFVLLGASAVTFVVACFNFGPAVLLPENFPTQGQRGVANNLFDHLLYGKGAPAKSTPTEPLPWVTGTWFWWKAWGLYSLLAFGYFWFAFWDEARDALQNISKFLKEKERSNSQNPDGNTPDSPQARKEHFWKPDFFDLISMLEIALRVFRSKT